jgi:hypothetical protein
VEFRLMTCDPNCSAWLGHHAHNPGCAEAFGAAMSMWIADGSEQAALLWAASLPERSTGKAAALQRAAMELPQSFLNQAAQVLHRLSSDDTLAEARVCLALRLAVYPAE